MFIPILDPFLLKIDYNQNNLAERFYPDGKKHNVVVDPHHQFGQPTIIGTNIKTETIYNLYKGGEKKSDICLMYDLSKKGSKIGFIFICFEPSALIKASKCSYHILFLS